MSQSFVKQPADGSHSSLFGLGVLASEQPGSPCTVCGKPYAEHGTFPTCATHPYTADGNCQHVIGAACVGAECAAGCVRARGVSETQEPKHDDGLLPQIADYDEPGSWGRASTGWPEVEGDVAYAMYVFANCIQSVPYGSYVLMAQRGRYGAKESVLRVHAQHLERLKSDFKQAGEPVAATSIARREKYGKPNQFGNKEAAPLWTACAPAVLVLRSCPATRPECPHSCTKQDCDALAAGVTAAASPHLAERLVRIEWDAETSCLLVHMSGGGECLSLTPGLPINTLTGQLNELVQRLHTNCQRRAGGESYHYWTTQKDAEGFTLAYSWDGGGPATDGVTGPAPTGARRRPAHGGYPNGGVPDAYSGPCGVDLPNGAPR